MRYMNAIALNYIDSMSEDKDLIALTKWQVTKGGGC